MMSKVRQLFKGDKYAEHSGIELVSVEPGKAVARMPIHKHHMNGLGTVQGGAIFTLADFAFAAASNAQGQVAVAINANISFLRAAKEGVLTAEAVEVSLNPKLASYTVYIRDAHPDPVAIFQGMVYRKSARLESLFQ